MHRRFWPVLALALAAAPAGAQLAAPDPDWKETQAPPPPAFKVDRAIPLDLPGSALRFGVDPSSVSLGADGIVRYVVVASSASGTVNAIYEGIRCSTAQVKVFARHNPDSGWTPATGADWQRLHDHPMSRHSLIIARTGACMGDGANRSAAQIVRDLRARPENRFDTQ